jgi:hypothetical protein
LDQLSRIALFVYDFLWNRFHEKVESVDQQRLNQAYLAQMAAAGAARGPLPRCIGFIDGTLFSIARPKLFPKKFIQWSQTQTWFGKI